MGENETPLQGPGTNSRGTARNARAKVAKAVKADEKAVEEAVSEAYNRARQLLLDKVTAIRALEKEVAGLRGSMLGIIESYDLTAEQANSMIGFTYFAEAPDYEAQVEDVLEKTAAAASEATPEPEPVEPDTDIRG